MTPAPSREPGKIRALALAIGVHLLLALALFLGVQWKSSPPDTVEVELWAPVTRQATTLPPPTRTTTPPTTKPEIKPAAKPPEPAVREKPVDRTPKSPPPDIKIKKEEKKPEPLKKAQERPAEPPKTEPRKTESKKTEPKPAAPADPKPGPEPRKPPQAPSFADQLAREEQERQRSHTTQNAQKLAEQEQQAAASRRGQEEWVGQISRKVRQNVVLPPGVQGNPEALFDVHLLPTGEVLNVRLKRSSGNPALDLAIERAIIKSSPLPKPANPAVFQRDLEIRYKPFED